MVPAAPGRYRGGMGLRRVYRAEADCRVRVDIARRLSAPWGLFGGLPGGNAAVVLDGGAVPFDHGSGALRKGEIVEVVTGGSGGYGCALDATREGSGSRSRRFGGRDGCDGRDSV